MLNQDYYVREKLRELEREQLTHLSLQPPASPPPPPLPVIGALARGAGRLLRRTGEGLESWAGRPAVDEKPMRVERSAR
jgi:hypothetical protein